MIGAGSSGATPFAPAVGANAISTMRAAFVVGLAVGGAAVSPRKLGVTVLAWIGSFALTFGYAGMTVIEAM